MHFAEYDSPIGKLLLCSDGEHLTGLQIGRQIPEPASEDEVIRRAKLWLDGYFRGENNPVDISLSLKGTAFQMQVWQCLQTIAWGETRTYGDIAREMALRMGKEKVSAQAVGQAVGCNPIGILIPCHRIVGAGGQLTGYAWGIQKKRWLLCHEGWTIQEKRIIR